MYIYTYTQFVYTCIYIYTCISFYSTTQCISAFASYSCTPHFPFFSKNHDFFAFCLLHHKQIQSSWHENQITNKSMTREANTSDTTKMRWRLCEGKSKARLGMLAATSPLFWHLSWTMRRSLLKWASSPTYSLQTIHDNKLWYAFLRAVTVYPSFSLSYSFVQCSCRRHASLEQSAHLFWNSRMTYVFRLQTIYLFLFRLHAHARALPFSVSLSRSLVLSLTLSHSLSHIHIHTYTHDTNKRHRSNATRARFAGWLRYPFQSASLRMPHHHRQNSRPSWRGKKTSWPKPLQSNKLLQWVEMAKEEWVVASTEQMWWRPGAFLLLNSNKSTRSRSKPLLRGPLHHSSAITITRRSSHCSSHCSSSSHRRRNYLLSRNRCRHSKLRWKHDTRRRRSISGFKRKKQLWIKSSTLNLHWFPSWIWSSCFKKSTFFLPPFAGSCWFIAEVIFVRLVARVFNVFRERFVCVSFVFSRTL